MESAKGSITSEILNKFQKNFEADPKNIVVQNACFKNDPLELAVQRKIVETSAHVFTHKIDDTKPITNQKSSGRCWQFATLNVLRAPFVKEHQLEDFEFSHSYIFLCDKIERCNFTLHTIVEILKRGEPIDGRLMSFILADPIADGGQWHMVVNLISKYGVIPKKCFPETFCCETSARLNGILKTKLREYARDLTLLYEKKASDEEIDKKILSCMEALYKVIVICLGSPPETFTWEYYNKSKAYNVIGPITPLQFYETYVKPYCNVEDKICFVNDPRPQNPYDRTYTVDCLGNMVGGLKTVYVNKKIKEILGYAAKSIQNNEPVWFGCDFGKVYNLKLGIQDLRIHDYNLSFGVDLHKTMSKAERLIYGDTIMNHAMTFTAVSLDSNGEPTKWRVENSWGEDRGEKGYLMMTSEWFEEFGFEIVVDKKYVPEEVQEIMKMEPKVLPAWDPMGNLAL
ncbi:bleomycin hydrolase isoform X2 [Parasteatoda tepidariorum]|uniref:Bleomycin hydrolase n=1 Tax=Parasteatoda tepidariorum TaxID=114398 RepID=A0A2L2Y592_PARTP|nr:bleomycin hydrolase isoform X2 [Parasteatoda tepidariorum]